MPFDPFTKPLRCVKAYQRPDPAHATNFGPQHGLETLDSTLAQQLAEDRYGHVQVPF